MRARHHLEPDGELIVTLGQTWNEAGTDCEERLTRNATRHDGSVARVYSSTRTIAGERIQELRVRFEIVSNGIVTDCLTWPTARLRWYKPDDFTSMLRSAGFESAQMQAGYGGQLGPDADLIFVARV